MTPSPAYFQINKGIICELPALWSHCQNYQSICLFTYMFYLFSCYDGSRVYFFKDQSSHLFEESLPFLSTQKFWFYIYLLSFSLKHEINRVLPCLICYYLKSLLKAAKRYLLIHWPSWISRSGMDLLNLTICVLWVKGALQYGQIFIRYIQRYGNVLSKRH